LRAPSKRESPTGEEQLAARRPDEPAWPRGGPIPSVLALQRTLGNHATTSLLQRMTDTQSGAEIPLDDLPTMEFEQLAGLVGRLGKGEVTATTEELTQIRNRLLEIRQIAIDAEIAKLEREIAELERQVEIDQLEDEIAELEKQEEQTQAATVIAPPSTPQLAKLVATPVMPKSTLKANASTFVPPSALKFGAPAFVPMSNLNPSVPTFVPSPKPAAPLPAISEAEFEACQRTGRIQLRAVKWWSSSNFPNHNIEIAIQVDGRAWAIAHVKWNDRNGPTADNVQMATFKGPTGASIYGGNIWGAATRDALVAEALKHASKAPPATNGHRDVPL
jgi:hypothetical protein